MYSNYDVFKYKALTASKFYWDIGHGTTAQGYSKVPANTWVVFLSKPGHCLHTAPFSTPQFKEIVKNTELTRLISLGAIPREQLPGRVHNSSWKDYIYGPDDDLPTTIISFQPASTPPTNFDSTLGVYNTSRPGLVQLKKTQLPVLLSQVLLGRPGIHFVVSCRPTANQAKLTNAIFRASYFNRRKGFTQNNTNMVPNSSRLISNIQQRNLVRVEAQRLCRLNSSTYRQACGISSPNQARLAKKPRLNLTGNVRFLPQFSQIVFAPGLPPTKSYLERMRKNRLARKKKNILAKKRKARKIV